MIVNFVLLQSPLAHGPGAVVVRRKCVLMQGCSQYSHHLSESELLTFDPTTSEIIWNFARLQVEGGASARITLEKNPHFYVHLPENEGAFGPQFIKDSTMDFSQLKRNDIVYVLVDRPGRVFLKAERRHRTFGNIWMLNGTLLFKGLHPPPPPLQSIA